MVPMQTLHMAVQRRRIENINPGTPSNTPTGVHINIQQIWRLVIAKVELVSPKVQTTRKTTKFLIPVRLSAGNR
jgi:hypothetical protein